MNTELTALVNLMQQHQNILVLTGAGISTNSGIPAYRDNTGNWIQSKPVQAQEFRENIHARKRYWHRSMHGWPNMQSAQPNDGHLALAALEDAKLISALITQNVDGLHLIAGSRQVVELHGSLKQVVCLNCANTISRADLQIKLEKHNPKFLQSTFTPRADGDAEINSDDITNSGFELINCTLCDGTLKPDVVFFGENVPAKRVESCMHALENATMLLCVGTSLTVFSGFRFCRAAHRQGKPVAIINRGQTRADDLARIKVNAECGEALQYICEQLI